MTNAILGTKPYLIAPSILSADLARLGEEVEQVLQSGADIIHFDVMDNHYVPNLTFGAPICKALRDYGIQATIDVHIMATPVDHLIEDFAAAGANHISIHPEATLHLDRSLTLIKSLGCSCGVVLNPATPLTCLDYILDKIDLILVMSVNPGFGGQQFIQATLQKIQDIKQKIGSRKIRIEVDGGIKVENIAAVAAAGADTFVAGSGIFNTQDYTTTIDLMRHQLATVHK